MATPVASAWTNVGDFPALVSETDDTGRIQRAVNMALSLQSLTARTSTVYLPTGAYLTSGAIYLDGSNPTATTPSPRYTPFTLQITGTVVAGNSVTVAGSWTTPVAGSVSITVVARDNIAANWAVQIQRAIAANSTLAGLVYVQAGGTGNLTIYCAYDAVFTWPSPPARTGTAIITITPGTSPAAARIGSPRIRIVGDGVFESAVTTGANDGFILPQSTGGFLPQTLFNFEEFSISGPNAPSGAAATPIYGIRLRGQGNVSQQYLYNVSFEDIYLKWFNYGIAVEFSYGTAIADATIEACIVDVKLYDSGAALISDCTFSVNDTLSTPGPAIWILGQNGTAGDALSEGVTLGNIITNRYHIGLKIQDQSWGAASTCSFTTCAGGALVMSRNAAGGTITGWQFSACQFNASETVTAITTDSYTAQLQFSGCFIVNSKDGMQLGSGTWSGNATQILVSGTQFVGNTGNDITLAGANMCNFNGNLFVSTNLPATQFSVLEQPLVYSSLMPGVNYIVGNSYYRPITLVAGAYSQQASNFYV